MPSTYGVTWLWVVLSAADPAERAFGQMMVDQVDEYIQGAGVGDMIEGSAGSAASAIMAARSANQRFRKSELVADVERELARYQQTMQLSLVIVR